MTNFNTLKTHDPAIDALRLVAILAVILIHTTTRELEVTHYDLLNQEFTLFVNQASRFAVPLFFMISGYVLELSYKEGGVKNYIKKRIGKLVVPYLFWVCIYYFLIYREHSGGFISAILTGEASYQLYFIPALIIFYSVFPFLHKFYRKLISWWVLVILGVAELVLLYIDYRFHNLILPYPVSVALLNFFVFIVGMIVAKNKGVVVGIVKRLWPVFVIMSVMLAIYIFNEGKNNYLTSYNYLDFYSQWRPSVFVYTIVLAPLLYLFLTRFRFEWVQQLSKLSFFVFFVHVIVLEALWKHVYTNDLVFFGSVTGVSLGIGYLAHRLPYLSKITG